MLPALSRVGAVCPVDAQIMDSRDLPPDMRMDGTGTIASRTNTVIATAIEAMHDQDVRRINRPNLSKLVINRLDAVGTEETAEKYVKRVTTHGPFELAGIGVWRLTDDGWRVCADDVSGDEDEDGDADGGDTETTDAE